MEAKQTPVYDHSEIEAKWQKKWEDDHLYDSVIDESKPKHYALSMLPYPSGDIHIGHWFNYIPPDARARFMRMRGYNVLFPVGFDAFGLPAENAAIKRNIHPKTWTYANIEKMRVQLRTMGTMFDWKREIVTSDPEYYKWTQWFFLQFFKNNLAYRKFSPVDWCPTCNTTLAREQVWGDDHHCERCGTPVIKKNLNQWFFRITKYAEELLRFDGIDWPERVKTLQTNWIGKSEGARVQFGTESGETIEVFTTRPDTLYGATFMVLAPEHPMVDKLTTEEQRAAVEAYKEQAQHLNEIQRTATDKEKTGVFTGGYAINPLNGARVPVWISDYVLITYGTGAIMAVPGHDDRDFAFALKFGLPILPVIDRTDDLVKAYIPAASWSDALAGFTAEKGWKTEHSENGKVVSLTESQAAEFEEFARNTLDSAQWVMLVGKKWVFLTPSRRIQWNSLEAESEILNAIGTKARSLMELLYREVPLRDALLHVEYGTIINSGPFSGTPGDQAKRTVIDWLQKQGKGEQAITYHLRDWLISRQRYWGAPIPIVYCD
ncbi:MAG TPA: class I tRNA ligase family protein, partial [Bellilinea sp.]|nr:class I tRNA ligase family protein [Bellilinea sp.]